MTSYFWVYTDEENGDQTTIAFCIYLVDANKIAREYEDAKIKAVIQKNTWEWQPI